MNDFVYVLDTSVFLSGKSFNISQGEIITTDSVSDELKPGGKDYMNFQFLKEKGLKIYQPSYKYVKKISGIADKQGEKMRLSKTDVDILAIAFEIKEEWNKKPVIVTDDYSIQNIAEIINIRFLTISKRGITKNFKWERCCRGCGKKILDDSNHCPVCGSSIRYYVSGKKQVKNKNDFAKRT
jgi:UPF0271 protein